MTNNIPQKTLPSVHSVVLNVNMWPRNTSLYPTMPHHDALKNVEYTDAI